MRDAGVGEGGVAGGGGGCGHGEALGGDLRLLPRERGRSGCGVAAAWRATEEARGYAEQEAVLRASLQESRDGPDCWPRGRPSVGGRWNDCGERRLLPAEYPNGGVLHDSAQGPREWDGAGLKAAVTPGDAAR